MMRLGLVERRSELEAHSLAGNRDPGDEGITPPLQRA